MRYNNMEEIWKYIPNYENEYQISNLGRVKSLLFNKQKILKTRLNNGYELVNLKGKTFRVHTLVANAFLPNPNNYKEINHKNNIRNDNRVENIEWCTRKYNCNYGNFPKQVSNRLKKRVYMINTFNGKRTLYDSMLEAEFKTNIDHSSIAKCCLGKMKTAGGYIWEYVDEGV